MKAKFALILFLAIAAVSISLLASNSTDPEAGDIQSTSASAPAPDANRTTLAEVLSVPSSVPRGPKELLQDYEDEIAQGVPNPDAGVYHWHNGKWHLFEGR